MRCSVPVNRYQARQLMQVGNVSVLVRDYIRTLPKVSTAGAPVIVGLVGGFGTGKTFLAKLLAKDLGITYLGVQDIKDFFLPRIEYLNQGEPFLIDFLIASSGELLKLQLGSVMDINLAQRAERDTLRSLATSLGSNALIVHVACPREVAYNRIVDRNLAITTGNQKGELISSDYFEVEWSRVENPVDADFVFHATSTDEYEVLREEIRTRIAMH